MPFVKADVRAVVDKDVRLAEKPGDLCYYFYKQFIIEWRAERRWTTAHNLYKKYLVQLDHLSFVNGIKFTQADKITALHLAWQVFMAKEVMPYELEMVAKNGDI